MGPNMGKASCKERSDKVREIVVGLGSDEEEEGKQNKSKDGIICVKGGCTGCFINLVIWFSLSSSSVPVSKQELKRGGLMERKGMNEYLQKCIGERQVQWRCMFLLQSMGQKKCFQLCGLERMFLRLLRERA